MGGVHLTEQTYKTTITVLSVFASVVLIVGAVLSIFTGNKKPTQNSFSDSTVVTDTPQYEDIISTDSAEGFMSILENCAALKYRYPDLIGLYQAGTSSGGREIFMLTLGHGEKKALAVAAVHAREHLTTKYLLRCVEDYCKAYTYENGIFSDYNIKELLDSYTLYVIPCVNPDGLEIIRSCDYPVSGVRQTKLSEYKANKNGVDINRNFPLAWESINNHVTVPNECYFKGYSAASEPETKALMKLCEENDFQFMISFHIKGNCIYWGDCYKTECNPQYRAFASEIASVAELYMTDPTEKAKDYGGGFENWFRHTYSRPGLCVELMSNDLSISSTDNKNYVDFNSTVNYGKTVYVLPEAMSILN